MPQIVAAGIAAAAGIAGIIANKRAQTRQNRANRELTELQNQQNVDLWNKQNEYNSPKAQMERYKEAGLNPYLAQTNPGLAGSPPTMEAPQQSYKSYVDEGLQAGMNFASTLMSMKAQVEGIRKVQAEADLVKKRTEVENEKLQDWRFRNLFGYSNNSTRNFLLNLQASNLYNKYRADWNAYEEPFFNTGTDMSWNFRRQSEEDLKKGLYYKMKQGALSYQSAGTDLRNLQYQWQNDQNTFGLGNNVPWFVSFARHLIQSFMSSF